MDVNSICFALKEVLQLDSDSLMHMSEDSDLLAIRMIDISSSRLIDNCRNVKMIEKILPGIKYAYDIEYCSSHLVAVISDILQNCKQIANNPEKRSKYMQLIVTVLHCTSNFLGDMNLVNILKLM